MVAGRYPRISPSSRFDVAATNTKRCVCFIYMIVSYQFEYHCLKLCPSTQYVYAIYILIKHYLLRRLESARIANRTKFISGHIFISTNKADHAMQVLPPCY